MKRMIFSCLFLFLFACTPAQTPTVDAPEAAVVELTSTPSQTPPSTSTAALTLLPYEATNTVAAATIYAASAAQLATVVAYTPLAAVTATRTQTATPRVTPTPGIAYIYDNQTDAEQRRVIDVALVLAKKYFADPVSVAIYTLSDTRAFCDAYARQATVTNCDILLEYDGFSFPNIIFLNLSSDIWKSNQPTAKTEIVLHEYVHIIQLQRAGATSARSDLGPNWLSEGSADFFAYEIAAQEKLDDLTAVRRHKIALARLVPTTLDTPLTQSRERIIEGYRRYALGYLAVEFLANNFGGDERILRYYSNLATTMSWQAAFRDTFGIEPAGFYDKFEEFRRINFPTMQQPR